MTTYAETFRLATFTDTFRWQVAGIAFDITQDPHKALGVCPL